MPALTHIESVSADGSRSTMGDAIRIPSGRRRVDVGVHGAEPVRARARDDSAIGSMASTRIGARRSRSGSAVVHQPGPGPYRVPRHGVEQRRPVEWRRSVACAFDDRARCLADDLVPVRRVVLGALGCVGIYRLRVLQVARRLNLRFEERLDERTRIAQELHDTLLQGSSARRCSCTCAGDRLPADSPAQSLARPRARFDGDGSSTKGAMRCAGCARRAAAPDDLEQAFAGIQQEFGVRARPTSASSSRASRGPSHPIDSRRGLSDRPRGARQRLPPLGRGSIEWSSSTRAEELQRARARRRPRD